MDWYWYALVYFVGLFLSLFLAYSIINNTTFYSAVTKENTRMSWTFICIVWVVAVPLYISIIPFILVIKCAKLLSDKTTRKD